MSNIAGQPQQATVTFTSLAGVLYDPFEVKWELTVANTTPIVAQQNFKYGVDPAATRLSIGVFQLNFVPTQDGDWSATADAFDNTGAHIAAGQATVTIVPRLATLPVA